MIIPQIAVIPIRLATETSAFEARLVYLLQTVITTHPAMAISIKFQKGPPPFGVAEEIGPKSAITASPIHMRNCWRY